MLQTDIDLFLQECSRPLLFFMMVTSLNINLGNKDKADNKKGNKFSILDVCYERILKLWIWTESSTEFEKFLK